MVELVLLHGRSQQGRDPDALKKDWVAALDRGLAAVGLSRPIGTDQVRFPYYGDTLDQLTAGLTPEQAVDVVVRGEGIDDEERAFIQAYLAEICRDRGITDDMIRATGGVVVAEKGPLDWDWVHATLRAIDELVPGASAAVVAAATRDVYAYLQRPVVRDEVDGALRLAITPGVPTVVVAHSLGSVVAFSMLRRRGAELGWKVPLLVTVGAPLGIAGVRAALAPIGHPECVRSWFNARDPLDIVALHPLDRRHFDIRPKVTNYSKVANSSGNHHGIDGYLEDAEVARRIHAGLS